eukprot:9249544-Pyramimonas_sp.AAC.1
MVLTGGDFNFAWSGAGGQRGDGSGRRPGDRHRSDSFSRFPPRWAEIHQPEPARREIRNNAL